MEGEIRAYYEIVGGPLTGTVLEPIFAFIAVKYPHRKTKDLYVPPIKDTNKCLSHPWHCCQETCSERDFHGGLEELIKHLALHAGRLLKRRKVEIKK